MNVLSLFDGMSCGQIALHRAGIKVDNYYASEIKPHAIKVTQYNFPNTIQLGDVTKLDASKLPKIDLLIGGSPCQDLSAANKERLGLDGNKSSLFWEYARILQEVKPTYFLLENVEMPVEDKIIINNTLGVQPTNINSNLVSGQHRNRWYWTNIPGDEFDLFGNTYISQPKDKRIKLKDVIESGYVKTEKHTCLNTASGTTGTQRWMIKRNNNTGMLTLIYETSDFNELNGVRTVTQLEMEKLQTVPPGYTKILNKQKAGNLLGDGWTVDVIAHIFSFLPEDWRNNE